MDDLVDGVRRFRREIFPGRRPLFERLANGQRPRALFVTCSDSRVVPELITQSQPGDLFISRNAGNIVPPYGQSEGGSAATIEYAVAALEVPDIIVCGHTDCGAMKGVMHPEELHDLPAVAHWLHHCEVARRVVAQTGCDLEEQSQEAAFAALTETNVMAQLTNLRTHPSVAAAVAAGRLRLHGWVYDIAHGEVRAYDPAFDDFAPLGSERLPQPDEPRLVDA